LAKYASSSWAFTNSLTGSTIANTDTNAWYNEAADLVCEMAKEYLYSNVWKDPQDAQIARGHVLELRRRFIREGRASQQTSYPKHYF
jgi:hypothetical protein